MTRSTARGGYRLPLVLAVSLVLCLLTGGLLLLARPHADAIHHVVLISIDTCRPDRLGCYGGAPQTTPNLDGLARESVLFENAYSPVPMTLPAHCSMLTGMNPPSHGVHDNFDYRLSEGNQTLAEILKEHGFATGAVVSAFILDSRFGLDQGFDAYADRFHDKINTSGFNERCGDETSQVAMDWLARHQDEDFLLFLHYYDPHAAYDPPEPHASRFRSDLYAGEIAFTDACIGRVIEKLKQLGLYESTLLIITADHGEMLAEHGEPEHSYYIYQSAVRVPLLIKTPGTDPSRRISQPVGLIDLVPTICGLLDIEPPSEAEGVDLTPCLEGVSLPDDLRMLYCESLTPTKYGANSLLGLVGGRWKFIQTTRPELYDLVADSAERINLASRSPGRVDSLAAVLQRRLAPARREGVHDSDQPLDARTRARLESLGYVAGSVDESFAFDQTREDPKDLLGLHLAVATIEELILAKDFEGARRISQEALRERPGFSKARFSLGKIAMAQGDFEEAASQFTLVLSLQPDSHEAHAELARALSRRGLYEEAIVHFKEALRLVPDQVEVLNNLAVTYAEQGDYEKASGCFQRLAAIDPDSPETFYNWGAMLMKQRKFMLAEKQFERAIAVEPNQFAAHNQLAAILNSRGQRDQAVSHLTESLRMNSNQPGARFYLAQVYAAMGARERALEAAAASLQLARSLGDQNLARQVAEFMDKLKSGLRASSG
jgi:arylsulfatase A-like enzyme/Flp pilus assembly protein TadD